MMVLRVGMTLAIALLVSCSTRPESSALPPHVLDSFCRHVRSDLEASVQEFASKSMQGERVRLLATYEFLGMDDYLDNAGYICTQHAGDEVVKRASRLNDHLQAALSGTIAPSDEGVEKVKSSAAELVRFLEEHRPPRD